MSNLVSKFFMAAVFVYVLTISAAWAERVLIDDPAQTVSVSNNFSCYAPANVTVDTSKPELYEQSSQLQSLTDGVRAMLSYECPQLTAIKVTGLIRGLDDVVYQGEALRNNNWQVKQIAAVSDNQVTSLDDTENQIWTATKRYDDELTKGQLEVTNIRLGMTVDQVTNAINQAFASDPVYDANSGVMTMNSGDCKTVAKADSKCIRAWFSDNRVPYLQRLELTQLVEGNIEQINELLIDKFGSPTQTNNSSDKSKYVWRVINQKTIEELDAVVSTHADNLLMTKITLYSTDQTIPSKNQDYADIDLKL